MALRTARRLGGAQWPSRTRRRQNWRNAGPRRVGQVGIVNRECAVPAPLARVSALSRQTSTFSNTLLSPASLKAELERRKELSDTRSELERRLMAFRSLRPRNFPIMPGSVARTKPSSPLFDVGIV